MPCSASGCTLDDSVDLHPCSVCEKPVHHICSNDNYEDAALGMM
jgi:hypothetical protein